MTLLPKGGNAHGAHGALRGFFVPFVRRRRTNGALSVRQCLTHLRRSLRLRRSTCIRPARARRRAQIVTSLTTLRSRSMSTTIIGLFDSAEEANQLRQKLLESGIPAEQVKIHPTAGSTSTTTTTTSTTSTSASHHDKSWWESLKEAFT